MIMQKPRSFSRSEGRPLILSERRIHLSEPDYGIEEETAVLRVVVNTQTELRRRGLLDDLCSKARSEVSGGGR